MSASPTNFDDIRGSSSSGSEVTPGIIQPKRTRSPTGENSDVSCLDAAIER